jgi:hypothetical protein
MIGQRGASSVQQERALPHLRGGSLPHALNFVKEAEHTLVHPCQPSEQSTWAPKRRNSWMSEGAKQKISLTLNCSHLRHPFIRQPLMYGLIPQELSASQHA